MPSSISTIGIDNSFYTSQTHNSTLVDFMGAASSENAMLDTRKNGCSLREQLDDLYSLAKQNHQESIELLQNIAMGRGEIATYAQDKLFSILCRQEDASRDAAAFVREGCQNIIMKYSNIADANNPKLLLLASARIDENEKNTADFVPAYIKDSVKKLAGANTSPAWFTPSSTGIFEHIDYDRIKSDDRSRFRVKNDGACQFRTAFALRDHNKSWLTNEKAVVMAEINKNYKNTIIDSIKIASAGATEALEIIPARFRDFFKQNDFCEIIYQKTIASGDFNLYSPNGIGSAIGDFMDFDEEEMVFLKTLADGIGMNLSEKLDIPTNPKPAGAYAETNGNHYNLIAPTDYFS